MSQVVTVDKLVKLPLSIFFALLKYMCIILLFTVRPTFCIYSVIILNSNIACLVIQILKQNRFSTKCRGGEDLVGKKKKTSNPMNFHYFSKLYNSVSVLVFVSQWYLMAV